MMKRIMAFLLCLTLLLTGCGQNIKTDSDTSVDAVDIEEKVEDVEAGDDVHFDSLSDTKLLTYMEDSIYAELENELQSDDYIIENVNAVYISQEYLDELAYNSQANIWFGYTMAELDEQFEGTPYVFTLSKDGTTEVVPFEDYDDTYDKVIKNVAIGTGVILVCVTVSVATGGAGAAPISMVFAASAKTGTAMALSSGVISGAMAGVITGIKTKNVEQAIKSAALQGSEGFKWGAIAGAIAGGVSEASALRNAANTADDVAIAADSGAVSISEKARQAELRVLEKYGGSEQVSYLGGEEVPFGTAGATRPDVVRTVGDHIEAIEVKYYNLESKQSLSTLRSELERQVTDRVANLPSGSTQRIVLDVTDRGFSQTTVDAAVDMIEHALSDIYPNIPIDIVGL